jgi:hypothetical protein
LGFLDFETFGFLDERFLEKRQKTFGRRIFGELGLGGRKVK